MGKASSLGIVFAVFIVGSGGTGADRNIAADLDLVGRAVAAGGDKGPPLGCSREDFHHRKARLRHCIKKHAEGMRVPTGIVQYFNL